MKVKETVARLGEWYATKRYGARIESAPDGMDALVANLHDALVHATLWETTHFNKFESDTFPTRGYHREFPDGDAALEYARTGIPYTAALAREGIPWHEGGKYVVRQKPTRAGLQTSVIMTGHRELPGTRDYIKKDMDLRLRITGYTK
jgi:hypothetical protein